MVIESPCHGCAVRMQGCHGLCEAYRLYRVEVELLRRKEREGRVVRRCFVRQLPSPPKGFERR